MATSFDTGNFKRKVFKSGSGDNINVLSLELFHYQCRHNLVYASYLSNLGVDPSKVGSYREIPFLPIGFFKSQKVVSGDFREEQIFSSSGTSGMDRSRHYVRELQLYRTGFMKSFTAFYGDPSGYRIFGLLPSYLEREGSSLIYMVNALMEAGAYPESGFFLDEYELLAQRMREATATGQPALLIGVSFALLDFSEKYAFPLGRNVILMETGGMKGRRDEITREELHTMLCSRFKTDMIHAEYGMTELLSQAYSKGGGIFQPPPWMKVLIRDIQDPFSLLAEGRTGAINIIDLANIHSCAFIETQDIGRLRQDGSFEVLGRTDASDIRGCSLLVS